MPDTDARTHRPATTWVFRSAGTKTHPYWQVGYYGLDGTWVNDSDHDRADQAGARVYELNETRKDCAT